MKTSRRFFLAGTVAMSAALLSSPSAQAAGSLIVTFRFNDGRVVAFRELDAVDGGAYSEPSGAFSQDHFICKNSQLPTVTVHFCRDRTTNQRPEIWIYHGTLYSHRAEDLPPHTVTIADNSGTVHTEALAYHGHRRWWRWQSAGPRPIIRTIDYLISNKWLPPYDRTLGNVTHPAVNTAAMAWPRPMENAGIVKYMPTAGERNDIGPITGEQALHLFNGNNWHDVLAQAEAAAAIPCHWIDEATGAPVSIYDRPLIQGHPNLASDPFYVRQTTTESGDWHVEYAHMPNTLVLAAMMTGDPYYVLMAQGQVSWWWTRNKRWVVNGDYSIGPFVDTETRGKAWRIRDYLVAWRVTPSNAPRWMNSQTYFGKLLEGTARMYRRLWFEQATPVMKRFHLSADVTNSTSSKVSFIREAFMGSMLAWWHHMGAPGTVSDLAKWKLVPAVAMASGAEGYPRQYCTPYHVAGNALVPAQTWGDIYRLSGWAPPSGSNLQNERTGMAVDWWFANQVLGALEMALLVGMEEGRSARDWLNSQVQTSGKGRFAKYAWSPTVVITPTPSPTPAPTPTNC